MAETTNATATTSGPIIDGISERSVERCVPLGRNRLEPQR